MTNEVTVNMGRSNNLDENKEATRRFINEVKNPHRFLFTCEIYDNETKQSIVNEGFNCSSLLVVIVNINEILHRLS